MPMKKNPKKLTQDEKAALRGRGRLKSHLFILRGKQVSERLYPSRIYMKKTVFAVKRALGLAR